MKDRTHLRFFILTLFLGVFLIGNQAYGAVPIAKITGIKGEVVILSGTEFLKVTQMGQPLNDGDLIQTKQGEAEVTFNDGAVMNVRPFTNASIRQGEDKSKSSAFRRITLFVGKLRFKSGTSKTSNYLQTPTAVVALRGSEAGFAYDPTKMTTYLNMYSGFGDVVGEVMRGFFDWESSAGTAYQSAVYAELEAAYNASQAATTPLEKAEARIAALEVARKAAQEVIDHNPDPLAKERAMLALGVINEAMDEAEKERDKLKSQEGAEITTTIITTTTTSTTSSSTTTVEVTVSPSS